MFADSKTLPVEYKGFYYGLKQQLRVITALVVRETATRFGKYSFGLLWALIEPAVYILIYLLLHTAIRGSIPFGESALVFFVSGIVVFRMYTSIASHCMPAITSNKALLCYPLVRPLDTIISRIILEWIIMLVVIFLTFVLVSLYLRRNVVVDKNSLIWGIMATMYLGACIGMFNAVISALLPTWIPIHSLLSFPLFFTSGLFYVPAALPPYVRDIVVWNPVLHCVEWVRGGMYVNYFSVLDKTYLVSFATIALVIALILERVYRTILIRQ